MKQDGKFTLFTVEEFKEWIKTQTVSRKITLIQNHHTYLPDYKSWTKHPDAFMWMKSMENSHKNRGFAQIAQHITTFPDGKICIGRPFDDVPAGIKGANLNGICIEHLGNFDKDADVMTAAHSHAIVSVNAILANKFKLKINRSAIVYHHWYNLSTGVKWTDKEPVIAPDGNTKTCPGTNFFGGNKPEHAESIFYPLINAAL